MHSHPRRECARSPRTVTHQPPRCAPPAIARPMLVLRSTPGEVSESGPRDIRRIHRGANPLRPLHPFIHHRVRLAPHSSIFGGLRLAFCTRLIPSATPPHSPTALVTQAPRSRAARGLAPMLKATVAPISCRPSPARLRCASNHRHASFMARRPVWVPASCAGHAQAGHAQPRPRLACSRHAGRRYYTRSSLWTQRCSPLTRRRSSAVCLCSA